MLTAALEPTDEENCIGEKITFAIFLSEDLKGEVGQSEGQRESGEKIGGEGASGAVFGWSCEDF